MDLPARLVMSPGQTLTFTLPGLGGAGYLWVVEVPEDVTSGDAGQPSAEQVEVLTAVVDRGAGGRTSGDLRQPVGRALPEVLRLTAHSPGTVTVRLAQRRPWEDGPPRDTRHTQVVVQAPPPTGHDATRGDDA